jgi:hypothetical protein
MSNCIQAEPLRAKTYLRANLAQAKEVAQSQHYYYSNQACQIQGPRPKFKHRDYRNLKSLTTYVHLPSPPDLLLQPSKVLVQTC